MKTVAFLISLLASSPAFSNTQCPSPTAFLGHTMQDAQSLLDKKFPGKWVKSGPLCWRNYYNLVPNLPTTTSMPTICSGTLAARGLQVFVLEDTSQVTSVTYILPKGTDRQAWMKGLSKFLGPLQMNDEYPDARPFKNRSEHREPFWNYWSADRKYYVQVTIPFGDDITVTVVDLNALNEQKDALIACFDGEPVTPQD